MEVLVVKSLLLTEMNMATQVQTLDESVCISQSGNTLWEKYASYILQPAKGK